MVEITSIPYTNARPIMSILCIAALLIKNPWLRVAGPIIVAALTTLATSLWNLQNYAIALIDPVPLELSLPALPQFGGSEDLVAPALGMAGKSGTGAFLKDCKLHLREATPESHGRSTVSLSP